jgi:hypothetical protein
MIRVPRSRVTPPPEWLERASAEREAAAEFFKDYRGSPFRFEAARGALPALMDLFQAKCAFCETRIGPSSVGTVCQFRPAERAIDLDGTIVTPAYWWLGNAWENLYLSCEYCDRNKGYRFPVGGRRARGPGDEKKEGSLLLDPCADDPERYLVFSEDGLVASLPLDAATRSELGLKTRHDRAAITIDVFGLNRAGLVEARRELWDVLRSTCEAALAILRKGGDVSRDVLSSVLSVTEDLEFAGLRRQVASEFALELAELEPEPRARMEAEAGPLFAAEEIPTATVRAAEQRQKQSAFVRQEAHQAAVKQSSIEDPADKILYRHTASLARVEIRNFRNIEELEFDIPAGDFARLGWKVLLGENGVGKSSVLQAIALTLMGAKRATALKDVEKGRLLRDGSRPPRGYVRIYLSAERDPLELHMTRRGISFPSESSNLRTFVLGFGATRWLPRRGALKPDNHRSIRVRNLFNPFMPLHDAPDWLRDLPEPAFRRAEPPILRLLERPEGDRLRRLQGRVVVHPEGEPLTRVISLKEMSDGYQAMLAVAGEIVQLTSSQWPNAAAAEGVVLMDEIGAHLHPWWKMRVIGTMRAAFPRMQFIASTHDPLCLRGLGQGEILVLRRDEDGELVPLDDLPGTETMRVDQLLTSQLFGLGSTLDPETEREFTEYYSLLAKRDLSSTEQVRLEELRETVGGRGVLGSTPRDMAIYRLVDEYLATHEPRPDEPWAEISDETKARVFELLAAGAPAQTA